MNTIFTIQIKVYVHQYCIFLYKLFSTEERGVDLNTYLMCSIVIQGLHKLQNTYMPMLLTEMQIYVKLVVAA